MMDSVPPLVFVYLGNPPPEYARDSMIFASGGYDGPIVLLTDSPGYVRLDNRYIVEDIRDWYDPKVFDLFRERADLDSAFMGGFWFHVVERFFVLFQYMRKNAIDSLFHAELDVMVFDLNGVSEKCDAHATGIFAVMDDDSRALASLFYVNSREKFNHFLEFALTDLNMRNEMEMIGRYLQKCPENGHALPSNPFFEKRTQKLSPSEVNADIGLFDASTFGHWLLGLDPKTVKYVSRNHFKNEMVRFPIEKLRFRIGLGSRHFNVHLPGVGQAQLRTLHVHSKIIRRLRIRPVLWWYLFLNRLPRPSVVTHQKGWWASRLLDLIFSASSWSLTKYVPCVVRPLLVRALLWLGHRGAIPMPNQQRKKLNSLLPVAPLGVHPSRVDEVWILSGDPESFDSQGLQRRLSSLIPSSNSRWIDGSGAKARLEKFQKPSQSSSTQTDSEREEQLARNLFQSQAKSVLVLGTSSLGVVGRNLMNSDGIQVLVPSTVKRDEAAIHTRNFMKTNGTRFEMDFSPDAVVYQPEYVRLIFKNDENEISRWARNGLSESAQPSLAQVYGVWLWTNKPKAVALGREL